MEPLRRPTGDRMRKQELKLCLSATRRGGNRHLRPKPPLKIAHGTDIQANQFRVACVEPADPRGRNPPKVQPIGGSLPGLINKFFGRRRQPHIFDMFPGKSRQILNMRRQELQIVFCALLGEGHRRYRRSRASKKSKEYRENFAHHQTFECVHWLKGKVETLT